MNDANNGSKLYLYSITTVAILGGLLFGYDTAVISGAEKGLEAVSYTHLFLSLSLPLSILCMLILNVPQYR